MNEGLSLGASLIGFVVLVVPGFLYVRGYFRGRARVTPEQPLYVLGQAVVASLLLIAAIWWLGGRHILHWAEHGTLDQRSHENYAYRFLVASLVLSFPTGLVTGGLVEWVIERSMRLRNAMEAKHRAYGQAVEYAKSLAPADQADALAAARTMKPRAGAGPVRWVLGALEQRELLDAANAWSKTWLALRRHMDEMREAGKKGFVMVRVVTTEGREITGAFGEKSWAAFAPHPTDLYIEEVYRQIDPTDPASPYVGVQGGLGIFVAAAEIESVEFRGPEATTPPGP